MRKSAMIIGMAVVVLGAALGQAFAQEKPYPTRQINYMVCFDPGGQSDRGARHHRRPGEFLGQKVIIDYKVGGGGALGWRELTPPKPDGYTIAGFNIPHIILQPLQQEVGYKTEQIVPVISSSGPPWRWPCSRQPVQDTDRNLSSKPRKTPAP